MGEIIKMTKIVNIFFIVLILWNLSLEFRIRTSIFSLEDKKNLIIRLKNIEKKNYNQDMVLYKYGLIRKVLNKE